MSELHIRNAVESDAQLILDFIIDLAVYEKARELVVATREDIAQSLFGEQATAKGLVCLKDNVPVGFAVYFYNYSTWLGKKGIYLEDLFVSSEYRGIGAGKALLQHLAKIAVQENCERFEWSVLDWNTPAIDFYDSIGAQPKSEWIAYQLTGERLKKFASNG